jgi:RecD/TraA family predicted helicase
MELRIRPTIKRFYSDETSYGIYNAEVHPDDIQGVELSNYGTISIKGNMPQLTEGQEYLVKVKKEENTKWKGTYLVESIRQDKPVTVDQQREFFETILTPNQVENIFAVYSQGEDIIQMIQDDEFDYQSVHGLGDKNYEKLKEKVIENLEMGDVLIFLSKYGIKYNMISKLVKEYKSPRIVIDKIEQNPYLLTEIKGIGFKKADEIAKAVGYDMLSPHRIDSCVRYVIGEENANGHSWINNKQLLNRTIDLLNIPKKHIKGRIDTDSVKGVVCVDERYTLEHVYNSEEYVSMRMAQIKAQSSKLFTTEEINSFLDEHCAKESVELEANQRQFFHDFNENNILLLVGGGGMGKSWLQNILLKLLDTKNLRTALLAPTGKASKVMANYTGRPASTIHRKAGVFSSDMEGTAEITDDVLVVDEASMCDVLILEKLFKAMTNFNTRILFVGDDFQLPSVGVGNFLFDTIHSNNIKISRLKKVFRQKDGGILNVATDIREGNKFIDDDAEGRVRFGKDCVFHLVDQDYIRDGYIHYYQKLLETFNPDDIVILSPTKKGKLGTVEINKEIQKIINPHSPAKNEKTFGRDFPITFRVGDLVMNVVNTYDMEMIDGGSADVFNGDTGKILDIDEVSKVFIIDFEGIIVKMKFENVLASLIHARAMTIHKSQGSQFEVVIVIVDKSMKFQLNANLLYTGFSRPKRYLLVLAQADVINFAMKKFANMERRSFMQELLDKYSGLNPVELPPVSEKKEEDFDPKTEFDESADDEDAKFLQDLFDSDDTVSDDDINGLF